MYVCLRPRLVKLVFAVWRHLDTNLQREYANLWQRYPFLAFFANIFLSFSKFHPWFTFFLSLLASEVTL